MLAPVLLSVLASLPYQLARANERHQVIVVGAGVSGFTAAATLLEHNVTDLIVLEASDRIGGRIHTVEFGGVTVEMGAEFVHGEVNNSVYEMVSPYDLLTSYSLLKSSDKRLYVSPSGKVFNSTYVSKLAEELHDIMYEEDPNYGSGPMDDYFFPRLDKYLEDNEVEPELGEALRHLVPLLEGVDSSADSLEDLGTVGFWEYMDNEGDLELKWKKGGYKIVFDFLSKKFPNPDEELPVVNKTIFGKEVTRIEHNDKGVKVKCADGSTYHADHVIVTVSLGVLKKHAASMFHPALPADKTAAIESLEIGCVAKVYMLFTHKWWPENITTITPLFTEEDLERLKANSTHGNWTVDTTGFDPVLGQKNMLCAWFSGQACRTMESLSEKQVTDGLMELLYILFSEKHKIPKPSSILRTDWNSYRYTRGAYSYRSVDSDRRNITNDDLAQPIYYMDKPVLMFAGEATHRHYYSTVHGALDTGRREANRLISYLIKQDTP